MKRAAPTEEMDKLLGVNFKGTFFCYKYSAMQMIKQGKGGRIVGATSVGGKRGASCLHAGACPPYTDPLAPAPTNACRQGSRSSRRTRRASSPCAG